ncbi:hypothetical protein CW751_06950 [Brumimicrobium salinarum]|uniref:Right handed beta helix domain-containing protein n=1 Tax=Brumimicrobium salinarum TaxID=2058658 RepID=A0A2I0R2U6_9FLAO|nr:right-handed parallel beta-helix repeat-containing protein [Brumimicrobium salinarum]PKR80901.1 hypothetical protein CW751_06950 [Brumimicrobium salinarum]
MAGLFTLHLSSCKKELLFSKNHLTFSVDTVLFDTVFTTIGTTTKRFKIYNNANRPVKIDEIVLAGGKTSAYRVNLDGESGTDFKNIVLPAEDSLFMFVEATLGETSASTPFIITDSVLFKSNGKTQSVKLAAWGRNAHFYNDTIVSGVWTNDKPHVIYNLALVDSLSSLTIQEGTEIYMHKGAMLYVKSAQLIIDGSYNNKVTIQGDRLEPFYADVKGQYYGIYLDHALESTIDNAVIKNGTVGVHIYDDHPTNTNRTLTITNTEISNHSSYGIFNYSGGSIMGENLNIHNNSIYAYILLEGGSHNFRHSQFLSYGSEGNQPAVAIKNYFTRSDGVTYIGDVGEGAFYNSIIDGPGEFQVGYDTLTNNGTVSISMEYNTNLIRQKTPFNGSSFVTNLWNKNIQYENVSENKFIIKPNTPGHEQGNASLTLTPALLSRDIDGKNRSSVPDIGAFSVD